MTTISPDKALLYKWLSSAIYNPHFWVWFSGHVWNGGHQIAVGYDIQKDVKNNHSLAMAVYPNGELHVFANGQDVGTPWSNLPTNTPLYGVVGHGSGVALSEGATVATAKMCKMRWLILLYQYLWEGLFISNAFKVE